MFRRALTIPAALALAAIAACGGDDSQDGTAATAAETNGASTTAAPSSGSAFDGVVATAEEEGRVVMYSVMVPDINERLDAAFSEAYPEIDLEIIRVPGNEIDAKLDAERDSGAEGADVVANVNYPWAMTALEAGDLAAFVGPSAIGDQWAGTDFLLDDRVQLSTFANIGLAWNTSEVEQGPTSFEDLLDPAYAGGKIGLPDPIAPVVADFYATLEDNYGPEFLEQLAAQEPVFFPGAVPLEQALAAGEITVAGYATNVGIVAATGQGAPLEFAAPENAWIPPIMTYIPAWAKRPNAAQVLVDFMASPDGQAVLGQDSFSPLPDVAGTAGPIESASIADVGRITEPGWYEEYHAAWSRIFGR